jgi:Tol biopolymer transport system component
MWGVSLSGGPPVFVTARLGIYSPDEKLVAYPESGQTYIERVGGVRWRVDNGGRAVSFSPDSAHIAWQAASSLFNLDRRQDQVWVAAVDGSAARQLATLTGGSLAGWFPDGRHLLVTSRNGDNTLIQSLAVADGALAPIASVPRLQGLALSPLGGWLAYAVAFSGDPSLDGLWVVAANGQGARRLDTFGGFAWRAEGRLLVIPLDPASPSNRLLEVNAATGLVRALTDPAATPFQIAEGNWSLSPDGSHLAFVSAADHNIWVMDLME